MKKNKRNGIKHLLAAVLFCMVLSIGMVSLADVQGTVIAKSAVIRASADPQSEKLASVPSGKTIDIISQTKGTDNNYWYQVYVDANNKGYIRGDLIRVPDGANIPTTQGGSAAPAQSTDAPTTADPVEARQVTVISNNTNIRAAASTTSESKAKANRGMVLTVTGETTGSDNKTWYQVTFTYNNEEKTGFVRSDLVTSDNVPADTATANITGEENPGEQPATEPAPEEAAPEQPAEPAPAESNTVVPMNVDEVPYIMPGFEPTIIKVSEEEKYNAYSNGAFYIFYGQKQNGEQGWYLFDSVNHVYQQYVYTSDGVTTPDANSGAVGLIPVIVLVVIIVVLAAVVGLLLIKLKGQGAPRKRYRSYDDDDRDDDIEDLEDMEDDDEPQPVRRPQGQPVRRPQQGAANSVQQGQPPRRPQGQQPPRHPQSQQPPRRMQGNPSNGNAPQGQQPSRRPQGGSPSNNGNGGARPQGQPARRPQGQPPRRPQPQNERVPGEKEQAQKGRKAKNLLEDDDMDFMDME